MSTLANPTPHPLDAAARDELARVRDLQQIVRDINWSLVFDCLRYETFTPHAREVLSHASDDLAALLASVRGAEADTWQLTRAKSALENYGRHHPWCEKTLVKPDASGNLPPCNCGYEQAIRDASPEWFMSKEWCLAAAKDEAEAEARLATSAHPPTKETDDE